MATRKTHQPRLNAEAEAIAMAFALSGSNLTDEIAAIKSEGWTDRYHKYARALVSAMNYTNAAIRATIKTHQSRLTAEARADMKELRGIAKRFTKLPSVALVNDEAIKEARQISIDAKRLKTRAIEHTKRPRSLLARKGK